MRLKKLSDQRHTLAFRLTLWYATIFTVSSFLAFLIFYLTAASVVQGRTDEEITEEIAEFSHILRSEGIEALKKEVRNETEAEDTGEIFFRIFNSDGSAIIESDLSSWDPTEINETALNQLSRDGEPVFGTYHLPEKPYPVRIVYAKIGQTFVLQSGIVLDDETRIMAVFKKVFSATMIIVFFLATLIGWFMARRALSGVEEVTQTAWQISEGAFGQRVPVKNRGREIEQLAHMFNHMLDSIQKVIREMREMSDNIAHDLKSPITRIRGMAEITLTTANSLGEYEKMAANTIEESIYLLEMINTMLDISETEAGTDQPDLTRIDLAALVREVCELFEPLAERKELTLTVHAPMTLNIYGDLRKLQRLMGNLLDNAVKYTPVSGKISVSLSENETGGLILSVRDTGIGISETDLPQIFERFYRCDQSRSKTGSGLGLSLVRAIVKSHRGEIAVRSHAGHGSTVTITLPRLSTP
ncbi:two-component sensor histidine kinase [Desulfonema ishimotonii]|uniref:histidine kinase n=1 Tax=Desulfonema ishimotonii TaxID=45657 RepID=A0A401FSZ7_9BACT|nr:ATP-binding protein [Desulfonema ishimotonii]GBC60084.1 two-component sensor histidine kinase [Desulfonema ishimotonii]